MSFSRAGGASSAPLIPYLDLRDHFMVGKREEKGRKGGEKGKQKNTKGS